MGSKQSHDATVTQKPVLLKEIDKTSSSSSSSSLITYRLSILSAKKGLIQEVDIRTELSTEKLTEYFNEKGAISISISVDKKEAMISVIIKDLLTFNVPEVI
jgi:hypothetical protein